MHVDLVATYGWCPFSFTEFFKEEDKEEEADKNKEEVDK